MLHQHSNYVTVKQMHITKALPSEYINKINKKRKNAKKISTFDFSTP